MTLRQAIIARARELGLTAYRLEQISGVQRTKIGPFLRRGKNITLASAEKLVAAMGGAELLWLNRRPRRARRPLKPRRRG